MTGSCFNFAKGFCRFGESRKYVHDAQANSGSNSQASNIVGNGSTNNNTTNDLLLKLIDKIGTLGVTGHSNNAQVGGSSFGANANPSVAFHTSSNPTVAYPVGPAQPYSNMYQGHYSYPMGFTNMPTQPPLAYLAPGPPGFPPTQPSFIGLTTQPAGQPNIQPTSLPAGPTGPQLSWVMRPLYLIRLM
ncbi:ribonuclease H-like domain-containing protein [Tanacetum coccineum]